MFYVEKGIEKEYLRKFWYIKEENKRKKDKKKLNFILNIAFVKIKF